MPTTKNRNTIIVEKEVKANTACYHCGTQCLTNSIHIDEKIFCCEGCKLVFEIINNNGLCDYYKLQSHPGLSQIKPIRDNKYSYLDNESIAKQLYKFTDGRQVIVTLYIPGVHCSSCMWLLEHMNRLNPAILESRLNFTAKEVTIRFDSSQISLKNIVELMATIGYEPYISLNDSDKKKAGKVNRNKIYKLGVAGFCFGNIMMMSFPEYLSGNADIEHQYASLFRILNLVLSIPVFFYSASEFFVTAWKGLKQKLLNIDAPIALALIITYSRSIYEIFTNTGAGYLDSMSGIVFFMLVGRVVQERTYKSISFHRDYKAYFPIAVNVVTVTGTESRKLTELKKNDIILVYNEDLVPADAIVKSGTARIDYSFVTGESTPVTIAAGGTVYAGGKQTGEQITLQIIKPVAGSYLTSLWNHNAFTKNKQEKNDRESLLHVLSKYFTIVLFILAAFTALYWAINDSSKILPSVSAMLIVACPCALLLAATFTNGNLLRIFSNNGLYLRDATVIEQLGNIDHIVFDKTGTLTQNSSHLMVSGHQLSDYEKNIIYNVAASSRHPYSVALCNYFGKRDKVNISSWQEIPGRGIIATSGTHIIKVGSANWVDVMARVKENSSVYVKIGDNITAFQLIPDLREGAAAVIKGLQKGYDLSLLSGDNERQKELFSNFFQQRRLRFQQKPSDKLSYVEVLQTNGSKVAMIGDGLNDAGALQQSDVGITLADDINNFTPSCDAILDASKFERLPQLMKLSKVSWKIIYISFAISILYNIVGLSIAVQGIMNPMIAAILMPISTLSIVLISTGITSLWARRLGLSLKSS